LSEGVKVKDLTIKLLGVIVVVPMVLFYAMLALFGLLAILVALGLIPVSWWL
jgi:hypothetical protein